MCLFYRNKTLYGYASLIPYMIDKHLDIENTKEFDSIEDLVEDLVSCYKKIDQPVKFVKTELVSLDECFVRYGTREYKYWFIHLETTEDRNYLYILDGKSQNRIIQTGDKLAHRIIEYKKRVCEC